MDAPVTPERQPTVSSAGGTMTGITVGDGTVLIRRTMPRVTSFRQGDLNMAESAADLLPGRPHDDVDTNGLSSPPSPTRTTSNWQSVLASLPSSSDDTTVQSVVAAQQYFTEHYYNYLLYLKRRSDRVKAFHAFVRDQQYPDEVCDALWKKFCVRESGLLRRARQRPTLDHFRLIKVLGRGAYGTVHLAVKEDTGQVCAVKQMLKNRFDGEKQALDILAEKEVLTATNSPWLVQLMHTFHNDDFVFIAMEYVPGGDLRGLLSNLGILDEPGSVFYLSEMIEAISVLHQHGYIHRDVKPENFLIDVRGHLKLTDFGLSKSVLLKYIASQREQLPTPPPSTFTGTPFKSNVREWRSQQRTRRHPSRRAKSLVGSPDYMAYELVSGGSYTHMVDFWAVGCIFFECLYGYPPFAAQTAPDVFSNILGFGGRLDRSSIEADAADADVAASDLAWEMIHGLVTFEGDRWGGGEDGLAELRRHALFHGTDWQNLSISTSVPFVPKLQDELDTSYFASRDLVDDTRAESAESSSDSDEGDEAGMTSPARPPADFSARVASAHAASDGEDEDSDEEEGASEESTRAARRVRSLLQTFTSLLWERSSEGIELMENASLITPSIQRILRARQEGGSDNALVL